MSLAKRGTTVFLSVLHFMGWKLSLADMLKTWAHLCKRKLRHGSRLHLPALILDVRKVG